MQSELTRPLTYKKTQTPIVLAPPPQAGLQRILTQKLIALSLLIIVCVLAIVLFSDHIIVFNDHEEGALLNAQPGAIDQASGRVHWLGTDDLGRDIFTRLLYGTRISMVVGFAADMLIVLVGVSIGIISGYLGGLVDNLLMRFTDVMYAFPGLLFAMLIVATLGRSIPAILIALGAANWVSMARLVRGQVLQIKHSDYVLSAHSIGASPAGIMWRHILPNILGPIIVLATLAIPSMMTAEASLAFLGVGIDPSQPTLGRLISSGMDNIFSHPSQVLFPVITLTILTLALTLIGDGLRDILDPRTR